jgi:Bacterial regulatory proteins, lacI family
MTVSRVLNSPRLVARPTRERVQAAVRDLGYVVNELARQIGTGRRPYISILAIKVATTPYSVDITLAVEQVAREHGWRTYLVKIPVSFLITVLAKRAGDESLRKNSLNAPRKRCSHLTRSEGFTEEFIHRGSRSKVSRFIVH